MTGFAAPRTAKASGTPTSGAVTASSYGEQAIADCGWGRLIFGQTFTDPKVLAQTLQEEARGTRDVAFHVQDPHLVLGFAPQALFLDPSHTLRLDLNAPTLQVAKRRRFQVRAAVPGDEAAINAIYTVHGMVPVRTGYLAEIEGHSAVRVLVAEDVNRKKVIGAVMGVDHVAVFGDEENGTSLWALAVDPKCSLPGVGQQLVLKLARTFRNCGRSFMELSVMHDNAEALSLYAKLGFEKVSVFTVKTRSQINEKLYIGPEPADELNIYAQIIIDEARRRGIAVEVEDARAGLFRLSLGSRTIACRESLCDLTSAVAMSRCDDKRLTHRLLLANGLAVPAQIHVKDDTEALEFLRRHQRVVVKPARGEQGAGVSVDLRSQQDVRDALLRARDHADDLIMEEFVAGQDLRIIVIGGEVVAAAIRKPATIVGDGVHTISSLIEKFDRRRAAATKGESRIPLDAETERCIRESGYNLDSILPEGEKLAVRKTANLHTGGTIHDVTKRLHPELADAAVRAAQTLDMPVVGLDFMVRAPDRPEYRIIEANERPGLANHEPAPTAVRFIDLLFPQTRVQSAAA